MYQFISSTGVCFPRTVQMVTSVDVNNGMINIEYNKGLTKSSVSIPVAGTSVTAQNKIPYFGWLVFDIFLGIIVGLFFPVILIGIPITIMLMVIRRNRLIVLKPQNQKPVKIWCRIKDKELADEFVKEMTSINTPQYQQPYNIQPASV